MEGEDSPVVGQALYMTRVRDIFGRCPAPHWAEWGAIRVAVGINGGHTVIVQPPPTFEKCFQYSVLRC